MSPASLPALVLFLFGLVVGSFLNVVIHRVPHDESVVSPRSRCPRCGTIIRWHQNIPVVSWILLRGRCAGCGGAIALRYPFVELANGVLWAGLALRFGLQPATFILLPFVSVLLALFFTDWDHQLLPDRLTLPLAAAGLVLAPFSAAPFGLPAGWVAGALGSSAGELEVRLATRLVTALAGAALGYGLFWAVGTAWHLLRGEEAIGGGDLKLMLGVGAFLGPGGVFLTIALGSLAGALLGLGLIAFRGAGWRSRLPYGCFLAPAALLAVFVGKDLLDAYLSLTGLSP